jgi:hypothetical protein
VNDFEGTVAAAAHKVAVGGGGVALIGGLSASDIAAFVGMAVAILGVAVSWYYKRKGDRRDAELHEARMTAIREGLEE